MALKLINAVFEETGITATAGIGTNLYLAKIAMDIVAKHVDDHIGILDEMSYRKKLWNHTPLTDFWRIGSGTAGRLARYGILTMGDVARASVTSEKWLYKMFGVDSELLIDHAWGYEPCRMSDIKSYKTETHSLSSGQVLMRNYDFEEGLVIAKEMMDLLTLDLVEKKLVTDSITLHVSYDHRTERASSHGSVKIDYATNSTKKLVHLLQVLYLQIVDRCTGIRRINITCNKVTAEGYFQYDMFTDPKEVERERNIQEAMLSIKRRYGKNAILKGCNLYECSTLRERNQQIGGHRS